MPTDRSKFPHKIYLNMEDHNWHDQRTNMQSGSVLIKGRNLVFYCLL